MADLTVLIPSRREEWLNRTVADVLAHSNPDRTRILVVLDGDWPDEPLPQDPRVDVLYHPESRGQRAACNEAARIATTPYIMKLDAHCSVQPRFDLALLDAAKVLPRETIQVPAQKNLHVFDWVCTACQWRDYMGPTLPECPKCKTKGSLVRDIIWKPRSGTTTTAWFFDSELHFKYYDNGRPKPAQEGDYPPVMSMLGACWFLDRRWFLDDLDGLDEAHGGWGQMGTELACKAWLSGGQMVCNRKTKFAHLFRTRGGFGFPWPITGGEQELARIYSRRLWRSNGWRGQVRPLSWLVERFNPPDWSAADRAALLPLPVPSADTTDPHRMSVGEVAHGLVQMPARAMGLSPVDGGNRAASSQVLALQDQSQVGGVAAGSVVTDDVVKHRDTDPVSHRQRLDEPSVEQTMHANRVREQPQADLPVAVALGAPCPVPAAALSVHADLAEQLGKDGSVEMRDGEVGLRSHASASSADVRLGAVPFGDGAAPSLHRPTEGVIYYSDGRPRYSILETCRLQLRRAAGTRPIVAVTIPFVPGCIETEDQSFAGMEHVVLPKERGYLTMFEQILTALKLLDTDYVHFCEHDVLYPREHFDECPMALGGYLFNTHVWKVDGESGKALSYIVEQTSGLSGNRLALIEHYTRRVAHVRQHGFSRQMGFEPGKPVKHGGIDDVHRATWQSSVPLVDIRHDANLTPSRWKKEQFRNQRYTEGWTEGIGVPGWDMTVGRFDAFLADVAAGRIPK